METPKIFTKNKYGVSIVKCCASCRFKRLDNRNRLCLVGEGTVPSSYVCRQWEMNPIYENVGKGNGNVKTSEYLHYALDRLNDDFYETLTDIHKGKFRERISLAELRREYEKKHGNIYTIERALKDEGI